MSLKCWSPLLLPLNDLEGVMLAERMPVRGAIAVASLTAPLREFTVYLRQIPLYVNR